jgi:hypothetical protein
MSFITSVSLRLLGDDIFVGLLGVGGFYRMYSGESLAFVGCGMCLCEAAVKKKKIESIRCWLAVD